MKYEFWEYVCAMEGTWNVLAIVNAVFVVLLGISFLGLDRDSGSFVAAVLALVVIAVYFVLFGFVRYQCGRLDQR
ncbi:MAG: hypothetical protein ABEJ26_09730 [Halosimplex sp.]